MYSTDPNSLKGKLKPELFSQLVMEEGSWGHQVMRDRYLIQER